MNAGKLIATEGVMIRTLKETNACSENDPTVSRLSRKKEIYNGTQTGILTTTSA